MGNTEETRDIVVIGAATGGIDALSKLVSELPPSLGAAVFAVVNAAPDATRRWVSSQRGPLRAMFAVHGEPLQRARVYVAPFDQHLTLRGEIMQVTRGPTENGQRPAIDALFRSAAASLGARVIGVVLTGERDYGTLGLSSIKARGGVAVVQDPADALAPSMPASAVAHVDVDHVVPLSGIAALLRDLIRERVAVGPRRVTQAVLELEGYEPGTLAPVACPACSGTMRHAILGELEAFRCHVGHVYTRDGLMSEQADAIERTLWAAVRALDEAADMRERLATTTLGSTQQHFDHEAQRARRQAEILRQLLAEARVAVRESDT